MSIQIPQGWEVKTVCYLGSWHPQDLGDQKALQKIIPLKCGSYLEARTRYKWNGKSYTLVLEVMIFFDYVGKGTYPHFPSWSKLTVPREYTIKHTITLREPIEIMLGTNYKQKSFCGLCSKVRRITDKNLIDAVTNNNC